jgi:hypothetical protein
MLLNIRVLFCAFKYPYYNRAFWAKHRGKHIAVAAAWAAGTGVQAITFVGHFVKAG